GLLALLYLLYFWMNLYILPRLMQVGAAEPGSGRVVFSLRGRLDFSGPGGGTVERLVWGLLNAVLLMILLGIAWGIAIYFEREYDFAGMDWTSMANRALGLGWRNAAQLVALYTAYGVFRELTMRKLLQSPRQNAYYITLV